MLKKNEWLSLVLNIELRLKISEEDKDEEEEEEMLTDMYESQDNNRNVNQ